MLRCYHNYHPIWTKYFLRTEVTMVHADCKREWWELKETAETFFFYFKKHIRIFNVTLLPQLPPNLDQFFSAHGSDYGTCTL